MIFAKWQNPVSPIMKKTWYLKQRICFQKYTYEFIMHDIPTVTQNSFYLVDDGGILAIQPTASQTIASFSSLHAGIIIFKNVPMTQINSRWVLAVSGQNTWNEWNMSVHGCIP
jgi:hypothetical protein